MTINPKTLPDGTVIGYNANEGYEYVGRTGEVVPDAVSVHTVFVPVPDGMDVDTATRILTDHDQWQPITGAPTEQHLGKRVRVDLASYGSPDPGQWYVHRDDAADGDDELIEAMAKAIAENAGGRWLDPAVKASAFLSNARAALAVVREREARP